jgi:hypothetical protein
VVRGALFAVVAGGLVGCTPPTQLVVVADVFDPADPATAFDDVVIEAHAPGDPADVAGRRSALGARSTPFTFGVVPYGAQDAPVEIHVRASFEGTVRDRTVETAFVPHRRILVAVDLSASCNGIVCAPGETCRAGTCAAIDVMEPPAPGLVVSPPVARIEFVDGVPTVARFTARLDGVPVVAAWSAADPAVTLTADGHASTMSNDGKI